MKLKFLALTNVFGIILSLNTLAQCAISDFFPIKHGTSLFDATILLNSNKNVSDVFRTLPFSYYEKPPYLNGDSVKISQLKYKINSIQCIHDYNETQSELVFCDDHLFRMNITISFSRDNLSQCQSLYNQLLDVLKLKYKFKQEIEITDEKNEKIGQGWDLYKDQVARKQLQYETMGISYKIKYYKDYEKESLDITEWGKIKSYDLEISYTNLFNTRLTRTQYY